MRGPKDDDSCAKVLDLHLHHPGLCAHGKHMRMRSHNALEALLRKHLDRTGAHVDMERVILEL